MGKRGCKVGGRFWCAIENLNTGATEISQLYDLQDLPYTDRTTIHGCDMFSSQDVAQSIEEFVRNKSYERFKNHLPRMKEADIHAAFDYILKHNETEMLNTIVHNASLSKEQKSKVLMNFSVISDGERISSLLKAYPEIDTTAAIIMSAKMGFFESIKALLPYASSQNIDRVFEYAMENGDWGIAKFLLPHISKDGDHANALIYASDANRKDLFDVLYTRERAQQAFKNIHELNQGAWGEGYNIKIDWIWICKTSASTLRLLRQ